MTTMFVLGFLGSLHCLGMCGGFVMGLANRRHHFNYQLGRLAGYAFVGAVLGTAGMTLRQVFPVWGQRTALVAAGLVMIALGCGLHLRPLPVGRLLPWLGRLVKEKSRQASVLLGMFTSLLPCGLLYAAYARTVASGNPLEGALLMAAFWCGTVPALAGLGLFMPRSWAPLAGIATVLVGLVTAYHGVMLRPCCH